MTSSKMTSSKFLYVTTGPDYHEYVLEPNQTYTIGDDIFACNIMVDGLTHQFSVENHGEYYVISTLTPETFKLVTESGSIDMSGDISIINDSVIEADNQINFIITDSSINQFAGIAELKEHAINAKWSDSTTNLSDDEYLEEANDEDVQSESSSTDFNGLEHLDLSPDESNSPDDVFSTNVVKSNKWVHKIIDNGPILLLRVRYGVLKERLSKLANQNPATFYSFLFSIVVIFMAVIVFAGISFASYSHNKVEQIKSQTRGNEYKEIEKYLASRNVINLSVRNRSGVVAIDGVFKESTNVEQFTQELHKKFPHLQMKFQLYSMSDIQANILAIERQFNLSCVVATDYSAFNCVGVVADAKNSLDDDINAAYLYENIIHLQLTLVSEKTMSDFLASQLSDDIYKNISYTVDGNNMELDGYIAHSHEHDIAAITNTFINKFPFMSVVNNVKNLDKVLNLQIAEIQFGQYGNVLVDVNNKSYGVGSIYNGFTINSIQKNYIEVQKGNNRIYLPTPFSEFVWSASSNNTAASGVVTKITDKSLRQIQTYSSLMSNKSNNNADLIKRQEIQTMMDDVITKKDILQHLQQEKSAATGNPKLQESYDKLINNLSDDVSAEEKEISVYNSTNSKS